MYKVLIIFALLGLGCNQDTISPPTRDPALALGNPAQDACDANHVLIEREAYSTYYSESRNGAEWSAWHLSRAWLGSAERSAGGFPTDNTLPAAWYKAKSGDYIGTGYDRGHLCPSADRTASDALNEQTFILSNILPQAPLLNREVWEQGEQWERRQVTAGNEVYIIAGGSGSLGKVAGKINVPASFWKVYVSLREGSDDLSRIDKNTVAFGLIMPNSDTATRHPWTYYIKPISEVETEAKTTFLSNLPDQIRTELISKKYEPD